MPEDEIHYKALQGLCDKTTFFIVGEEEETLSPTFFHYAVITVTGVIR